MKTVEYRRKAENKTNYKKRLRLLLSRKPRLVVRKSNKNYTMQIIKYEPKGDKVISSASTTELKKYGWKGATSNTSAAYLAGYLLAKKAGSIEAVPDIGMHASVKGAGIFAALHGSKQGGIKINLNESILPDEKKIKANKNFENAKKAIEAAQWTKKK
ncbi:50S ribosomal protein L18 [Candidatus Woesearchaeota archaeon]|nr:50S ribosomal protein L18 [Candidatus Woesearchaeota archaeon]